MVSLVRWLPFSGRGYPFWGNASLLFLPCSSLLLGVSPPSTVFHFHIKMDRKKELGKLLKIKKEKQILSNGLTLAHLTIMETGSCSRFRTFTIPMDGVQSNQLHPRFFRQLNPKDLLQEIPLLKSNLCAVTSRNKRRLGYQIKHVIEKKT